MVRVSYSYMRYIETCIDNSLQALQNLSVGEIEGLRVTCIRVYGDQRSTFNAGTCVN